MDAITEKTRVPIGLVWVVGGSVVGGVVWLTTIFVQGNASAASIREIVRKQDSYARTINRVDRRLGRIEDKLKIPQMQIEPEDRSDF